MPNFGLGRGRHKLAKSRLTLEDQVETQQSTLLSEQEDDDLPSPFPAVELSMGAEMVEVAASVRLLVTLVEGGLGPCQRTAMREKGDISRSME
jgi:hypothetical protein